MDYPSLFSQIAMHPVDQHMQGCPSGMALTQSSTVPTSSGTLIEDWNGISGAAVFSLLRLNSGNNRKS
ncbi:MAG: hypothetical protein JW801_17600 [Bacteroidales bacterium]|nr:hypothetical protein [Bacteroidales bacterium]